MLIFTVFYVATVVRFLLTPLAPIENYLNILTPSYVGALLVFGGLELKQKQMYKK